MKLTVKIVATLHYIKSMSVSRVVWPRFLRSARAGKGVRNVADILVALTLSGADFFEIFVANFNSKWLRCFGVCDRTPFKDIPFELSSNDSSYLLYIE